jgi:hypothetical protein
VKARLVVFLTVVLLVGCGDEWQTDPALNPSLTTPAPATTRTTGALEGVERVPGTDGSRGAPAGAERAARVFLRAYLLYGYGRGSMTAAGARMATPTLRRQLRDQPVRMTAEMRKAKPQLTGLRVPSAKPPKGQVLLYADIEDGVSPYTLLLTVVRHRGGWAVARVAGA